MEIGSGEGDGNDSSINTDQQSKPSAPCPSSLTLTAAFLIRTQLPLSQLGHVTISPAGPWENRQEDGTKEYWGPHHRGLENDQVRNGIFSLLPSLSAEPQVKLCSQSCLRPRPNYTPHPLPKVVIQPEPFQRQGKGYGPKKMPPGAQSNPGHSK